MNLSIYTDGGSLNNPGQAASAFLVSGDGKLLYKEGRAIGIATNNIAEYTALIRALEWVKQNRGMFHSIHVISDSQLMIRQVNGEYKVKDTGIKKLHSQVKLLEMELGLPISYTHVLREKNKEADALVKQALGR